MNNKLVVKSQTVIASSETKEKDILDYYYDIPAILDRFVEEEKKDFLNSLYCGTVVADSLNQLAHSESFFVEIPKGLREKLKTGEAVFDTSAKASGSNTPNIRLKGGKEIVGQATITKKTDSLAVTRSLSNLAMMAMVQTILYKIDVLDEKVEDLKRGQINNRVGKIIGSFKSFMDLYPTFNNTEELNYNANSTYRAMQEGLGQIHLHINEVRKKLNKAPTNNWKVFWHGIVYFFGSDIDKYRKLYNEYITSIQLYNRLSLLSDVVLHLKNADSAMSSNHKTMYDYCNQQLTDTFKKSMKFLLNREPIEIERIHEYNIRLDKILKEVQNMDLVIECRQEDVKLLNTTQQ
jgi:hypothetical protein